MGDSVCCKAKCADCLADASSKRKCCRFLTSEMGGGTRGGTLKGPWE